MAKKKGGKKSDNPKSEEEMIARLEREAEWVDETLFEALQPLLDKVSEKDDPLAWSVLAPSIISAGISLSLETLGQEETIIMLKEMITSIEQGEFESSFEWEGE